MQEKKSTIFVKNRSPKIVDYSDWILLNPRKDL